MNNHRTKPAMLAVTKQQLASTRPNRRRRNFRRLAAGSVVLVVAASTLSASTPVMADHTCDSQLTKCTPVFHGFDSRDKADWTPDRFDEIGSTSWYVSEAPNTGTYHYTYASGGRVLDNYARWTLGRGERLRGAYEIWVRIPEGDSLSRPPTATVYYEVFLREDGAERRVASFIIDQRRQRGWVNSKVMLVLRSPQQITVTMSDKASWPDISQAGRSNSRVAVDALYLNHARILDEDRTYARLQCAARTSQGRDIDLQEYVDEVSLPETASAAVSVGATVAGLTPVMLNPVGAGIVLGVSLADPLTRLIYGESFSGLLSAHFDNIEIADRNAVIRGASHGGRWPGGERLITGLKWFVFSNPGPCELFQSYERYLPQGA